MLEVRGLIKRFAAIQVLHGVNLELRAGEVVGYLGPNGSGKSVTTRILTGLIEPSAGTVSYNGRNIHADLVEFRRHVGYVPEEPHLYPFLTGHEYLRLVGRLRQLGEALLHALFIGFRQVPFASPYVSLRNPKLLWPISYAGLFLLPSIVAAIEREAFTSLSAALTLIATLTALAVAAAVASNREDAAVASLVFEELPEDATQRLGLSARMVG